MFSLRKKDGWARIGRLETAHGQITTPVLLPVLNPNHQIISPNEMVKYGAEAFITNAYLLHQHQENHEKVLQLGLHKFIGTNRPIMTDSGAFQLMAYGDVEVTNPVITDFQENIATDIGVFLDVPVKGGTLRDHQKALSETLKRADEHIHFRKPENRVLWAGPIQGGQYTDLVEYSSLEMGKKDFDVHPIGSVVPLMEKYDFNSVIKAIITAKQFLPFSRPIHLFGAGHPMFFGVAVLLGVDMFDSAAYILYAKKNRYITVDGTDYLENITFFPCSCEMCSQYSPDEVKQFDQATRTLFLAKHNLIVSLEEINRLRQVIQEGRTAEYVLMRMMAHPALAKNLHLVFGKATSSLIEPYEPISKPRSFLVTHPILSFQPLLIRYRQRILERFYHWQSRLIVTADYQKLHSSPQFQVVRLSPLFGIIPDELRGVYPLAQHERIPLKYSSQIIEYLQDFFKIHSSQFDEILVHPSVNKPLEIIQDFNTFERPKSAPKMEDIHIVNAIADYQFGTGVHHIFEGKTLNIERSRKTGILRNFSEGKELLGTFRASDFSIIPSTKLAQLLHGHLPKSRLRVVANAETIPFVTRNKDLLARFVDTADPQIRCGEEVIIIDENSNFLNHGRSMLSAPEMLSFRRGVAVQVRH